MKTTRSHNAVLDGYLLLAASLSATSKLDLIAELSASLKTDAAGMAPHSSFAQAFGAFESEQTAEEIIAQLRSSRTFNRQIESF